MGLLVHHFPLFLFLVWVTLGFVCASRVSFETRLRASAVRMPSRAPVSDFSDRCVTGCRALKEDGTAGRTMGTDAPIHTEASRPCGDVHNA